MTKSLHTQSYANLVAVLIAARLEKRLTQQQVAKRLGKPQSHIAKIEGAERRLDLIEFIELCRAIESDPIALFGDILQAVETPR